MLTLSYSLLVHLLKYNKTFASCFVEFDIIKVCKSHSYAPLLCKEILFLSKVKSWGGGGGGIEGMQYDPPSPPRLLPKCPAW